MGMIRKLIVLGAAKKIAGMLMKRHRASAATSSGAAPAQAAHSKDAATQARSGQNSKAASAGSH